jgi:hypothetical protein
MSDRSNLGEWIENTLKEIDAMCDENKYMTIIYDEGSDSIMNVEIILENKFVDLDLYDQRDILQDIQYQIEDYLSKVYQKLGVKHYLEEQEKNDDNNS